MLDLPIIVASIFLIITGFVTFLRITSETYSAIFNRVSNRSKLMAYVALLSAIITIIFVAGIHFINSFFIYIFYISVILSFLLLAKITKLIIITFKKISD